MVCTRSRLSSNDRKKDLISVLIPAFNCADSIVRTVNSAILQTYPPDEIIVIANGSGTSNRDIFRAMSRSFPLERKAVPARQRMCSGHEVPYEFWETMTGTWESIRLLLLKKRIAGKADALNAGITYSTGHYIITLDADTFMDRDCIANLCAPVLMNHNVIAVGGNVVPIVIHGNLITSMQMLEYLTTFHITRAIFNRLDSNILLSGALSMFNRGVLYECGGFTKKSIGEDFELSLRLNRLSRECRGCWGAGDLRISYAISAVCRTAIPENIGALVRQRTRWYIGLIDSLKLHRIMIFNPQYGSCGMLVLPYLVIFEVLAPFLLFFWIYTIVILFYLKLISPVGLAAAVVVPALILMLTKLALNRKRYFSDAQRLLDCGPFEAVIAASAGLPVLWFVTIYSRIYALVSYHNLRHHWLK